MDNGGINHHIGQIFSPLPDSLQFYPLPNHYCPIPTVLFPVLLQKGGGKEKED